MGTKRDPSSGLRPSDIETKGKVAADRGINVPYLDLGTLRPRRHQSEPLFIGSRGEFGSLP
jgi:hypothetical protein